MTRWLRFGLVMGILCALASHALAQGYRIERIASGLDQPTYVTQAPGDPANIIYYAERITAASGTGGGFGAINNMGGIYRYDMNTRTSTQVMSLAHRQLTGDEGLAGFSFSPDFNTPGSPGYQKLYVSTSSYNGGASPIDRVEEYVASAPGGTVPLDGFGRPVVNRLLLQYLHVNNQQNHTVNWIGFDPRASALPVGSPERDYLYIVTGDGDLGGAAQTRPEQKANDVQGKLLRVDVNAASSDAYPDDLLKNFAIPATNPIPLWNSTHDGNQQLVSTTLNYTTAPSTATYGPPLGEVYATGLRNSFRASFDRQTGDFWAGDVGENRREEINFMPADPYNGSQPPLDYGYAQREGTIATNSAAAVAGSSGATNLQWDLSGGGSVVIDSVNPIREGLHATSTAVDEIRNSNRSAYIGGYVYRGPVQELQGKYFYSDFIHSNIFMLSDFDRTTPLEDYSGTNFNLVNGVAALGTRTTVASADATSLWQSLISDPTDPGYTSAVGASFGIGRAVSFGEDNAGNLYVVDFGSNRGDSSFGGDYPNAGLGEIFRIVPTVQFKISVNRNTGAITFSNATGVAASLKGYQLTSASGAIDPLELTPVTGRLDASGTGNGSIDPTSAWQITSPVGSQTQFSEASTGAAPSLASNASFTLSPSEGWTRSIYEDLQLQVTLADGSTRSAFVEYTGNGGAAFARGDLNFDGVLAPSDWLLYRQNFFSTFSGLTIANSYRLGDLDGDLDNDYNDFLLFKADYIAANGAAAFAALQQVPEPNALVILVLAGVLLVGRATLRGARLQNANCKLQSVNFQFAFFNLHFAIPSSRSVVLPVISLALLAAPARAVLTHQYTFNVGLADRVGGATGQAFGVAAVNAAGQLVLPGGANDYVGLNGDDINIANYTDLTIEAWFTINQVAAWQRVFDFGDRTVPNPQQGYIYYTPTSGANQGLGVFANAGARTEAPHTVLTTGQMYHLAFVIDDDANGGSDLLSIYINGAQVASVAHTRALSAVSGTFALLGESLVPADANFNGTMDEFRIHDNAFTGSQVSDSFLAGPTPLPTMRAYVNTVTGAVTLATPNSVPFEFDYYALRSAAGALRTDTWNSLEDNGVGGGGLGPGEGWEEADLSNANRLGELYLLGASITASGSPFSIGRPFNPATFGSGVNGDLTFEFGVAGEGKLIGQVIYLNRIPGDFTGNNVVDAADYTIWRDNQGATSGPGFVADHSGPNGHPDGVVNSFDYDAWRSNFGQSAPVSAASVPEPAAWVMLIACCYVAASVRDYLRRARQEAELRGSGS